MPSDLGKIFAAGAESVERTPGAYGLVIALRAMASQAEHLAALTPGPVPSGGEFGPLLPAERQVAAAARQSRDAGEDIPAGQAAMLLMIVDRLTGGQDYTRRGTAAYGGPVLPGVLPGDVPGPPADGPPAAGQPIVGGLMERGERHVITGYDTGYDIGGGQSGAGPRRASRPAPGSNGGAAPGSLPPA